MPQAQSLHEFAIEVIVMSDDDNAWQRILDGFSDARLTPPMRFDAVNGSRLTPDELNTCLTPRAAYELSVGRPTPWLCQSQGHGLSGIRTLLP